MPDRANLPHPPVRVLVVDDERLARVRLEDLLRREPDIDVVGLVNHGGAAVEAIRRLRPDIVFLDVQMPVLSGFDVLTALSPAEVPVVVFVTAFDQYAVQAFDQAAVDYLLKPFSDARFDEALRRARRQVALAELDAHRAALAAALTRFRPPDVTQADAGSSEPAAAVPAPAVTYVERIPVEMRGKVMSVPVSRLDYVTASGSYAELHTGDRTYLIRESMQSLEARLDPALFLRVHRSVIVRLALVEVLHRSGGGDYEVQLKTGIRLPVSRSRHTALERWLGLSR